MICGDPHWIPHGLLVKTPHSKPRPFPGGLRYDPHDQRHRHTEVDESHGVARRGSLDGEGSIGDRPIAGL